MSAIIETPQLYSTKEVAAILGISVFTVRRLRDAGKLTALRVGVQGGRGRVRYSAVEVNRYIDSLSPDAQDSP